VRKRLLIVEDGGLDRGLLAQIFEDLYEIELAPDGEAAVEIASSTCPDLVLLDVGAATLNVLEAVRAIRAGTDVPVIAVSSRVMPADRRRAIEAGCDEFVAKPIDDAALVEKVDLLVTR
jgi:two-component system cell cycle response regulator DivK